MAQVGVAVVKSVAFRDSTQEFTNVYHYQWTGLDPAASLAESLLDRIVVLEKLLHSPNISFIHGRVWNSGGTKEENDMVMEKALTGVGSKTAKSGLDKERAILVRWRAGVDSRGRPVYLRKYFHTDSLLSLGIADEAALLENRVGFTAANRAAIVALVEPFHPISFNAGSTIGQLVAESGRGVSGALEAHKYLEHHQLGDMWRG